MPDTENGPDETIEIVARQREYRPTFGEEAQSVLDAIPDPDGRTTIRDEALQILNRCVRPDGSNGLETGLVVGYVQSGKTASFTTVAALARDNGYPIVIVIAGTNTNLTEQSIQRLRRDLGLETRMGCCWLHIHNPSLAKQDDNSIRAMLADWNDPTVPQQERRTALVTVMKHHKRLRRLVDVLRSLDLSNVPVIAIDDEADDQAGLNNLISQGSESTTYSRLAELKSVIPNHTFLQYTATPQGPLLINLIDVLSPEFAVVLTPGQDYTGGTEFFRNRQDLVRVIPWNEIPGRNQPLTEPPQSLLLALRLFYLGVASGILRNGGCQVRSMMIHPSNRTASHAEFHRTVHIVEQQWLGVLDRPADADYQELLEDFEDAYADLRHTVEDLEPFDSIIPRIKHAIRRTRLHLVNAVKGRTPKIDWRSYPSHILVGGTALDRGFTVQGLTITYMPRGVGVGNVDTVQQRARFFGYKKQYIGYCRVFLEKDVADAFERYVKHEEDIRSRLTDFVGSGRPLSDLKRVFLLDPNLRPTRNSILDIDYVRVRVRDNWFYPDTPHEIEDALENNRRVAGEFCESVEWLPDDGSDRRTDAQRHLIAELPIRRVFEDLLVKLRFASLSDAQGYLGILFVIKRALDSGSVDMCRVYQMSSGIVRERALKRGRIAQLFQGAAPVNPPEERGSIYLGDRLIFSENMPTVQLHTLDMRSEARGAVVVENVPVVAVRVTRELAEDFIYQNQGQITELDL